MPSETKYWFPAKRYGWGWGLPNAWQGWVVLAAFLGLLVAGCIVLVPTRSAYFFPYLVGLCLLLLAVCWLKGEPPGWRWGPHKRFLTPFSEPRDCHDFGGPLDKGTRVLFMFS